MTRRDSIRMVFLDGKIKAEMRGGMNRTEETEREGERG
jgi:hypothetical protein